MAIQILIISDDRSGVEPLIHSLAAREARSSIQPVDPFLLPMIRETRPAAIVVDVSGPQGGEARELAAKIKEDAAFDSVPLFGVGGELDSAVNSYESFGDPDGIVAEVLAIADLHIGFDTTGANEAISDDDFADIDELLSPTRSGTGNHTVVKKAPRRSTGAAPPPPPPPPPPAGGSRDSAALREELKSKDEELEKLSQRVQALEDQISGFEDELDNRQAELDRLAKLYDDAQSELKAANEARAQAEATVTEIQQEFAERSAEIEELLEAQSAQPAQGEQAPEGTAQLVAAMKADLGVYVAAAHRSAERDAERVEMIKRLQSALADALSACEEASVDKEIELAATTWEKHLDTYEAIVGEEVEEEGDEEGEES